MRLSDAASSYLLFKSTRCTESTIETDRDKLRQLREFLGDVPVDDITAADIRQFLAHEKQRGLSPHTVKRQYATFSAFYTWLTSPDVELAKTNPIDRVSTPKTPEVKPKALNPHEVRAVFQACNESGCKRRDKAVLAFALDTGARASEICGVRIPQHVEFKSGRVLLTETKGGRERYVYMSERTSSLAYIYAQEARPEPRRPKDNFLFLTIDGRPLTRDSLRNLVYRLADRAGIHASPLMLRHTMAITALRSGGVSLMHLAAAMGHRDTSTTKRYLTALNDRDVQEVMQRCSPVKALGL